MPTPTVSHSKMAVGKKGSGKHWTKAEVESRQAAAEKIQPAGRASLRVPDWLGEEARKVWARVRKQTAGLELLDNLDAEMLGIYCDAVARYRQASKNLVVLNQKGEPVAEEDRIKAAQSWARIVAAYADKLGLSPAARARLAKKRADDTADPFDEEFS
jgi:P27 family predicted phage terminase small subunit